MCHLSLDHTLLNMTSLDRLFGMELPFMVTVFDRVLATIAAYPTGTLDKQIISGERTPVPDDPLTGQRHKQRHKANTKNALATIYTTPEYNVEKETCISHLHVAVLRQFRDNIYTLPDIEYRLLYILLYLIMFYDTLKEEFLQDDAARMFFNEEQSKVYSIHFSGLVQRCTNTTTEKHTNEKRKQVYKCALSPMEFILFEQERYRQIKEYIRYEKPYQ